MNVFSAEFVKGIRGTDDILYDEKRQIVFAGRSNVGKSSLINSLVLRKHLARSSSKPGKTIRLDFFLINNGFYFVDLPGYGYADFSKKEHEDIRKMMLWYLEYSGTKNRSAVLVIDACVGIKPFDREMMGILKKQNIPFVIAANKADKLKKTERKKQYEHIRRQCEHAVVIPYSAITGEGRKELLKALD